MVDIYRAGKRARKYPPLAIDAEVVYTETVRYNRTRKDDFNSFILATITMFSSANPREFFGGEFG